MSTFLDLLKEMLPNSSDKVQAWIGVIGLILAILLTAHGSIKKITIYILTQLANINYCAPQ